MFDIRRLCAVAGLGTAFGVATSLSNAVAVPFKTQDGSTTGDPLWAQAGEILSIILDSGWAWAALAVFAGWLVGSRAASSAAFLGGLAGLLALLGATVAYYAMDSVLRSEPVGWGGIQFWWWASLITGPVLGAIGSRIGHRGISGLLAGLTVPIGAATQMVVLPHASSLAPTTRADTLSELIVWVGAALGAGLATAHWVAGRRSALVEGRDLGQEKPSAAAART